MADLVADIRGLVEKQLAWATYPEPARPQYVARGLATEPTTPPAPEAAGPAIANLTAVIDLYDAVHALDKIPGWSHDQDSPPAAPRPRTWKAGDDEPATAGPGAVWGVTNELGDLYRPQADEEHGWVWARADGTWWRWETMLTAGSVTETFPPSPTPHTVDVELPAEDETTPAPEALAGPVASDNTTTTDPAW